MFSRLLLVSWKVVVICLGGQCSGTYAIAHKSVTSNLNPPNALNEPKQIEVSIRVVAVLPSSGSGSFVDFYFALATPDYSVPNCVDSF